MDLCCSLENQVLVKAVSSMLSPESCAKTALRNASQTLKDLVVVLRKAPQEVAIDIVDQIIAENCFALLWSRIFLAASERQDCLVDELLPIAMSEQFLISADTRKDAIDLVATGYARPQRENKISFEQAVDRFDFSQFTDPPASRDHFFQRLLTAIGVDLLATEVSRSWPGLQKFDEGKGHNRRLYSITTGSGEPEPYHWIKDLDRNSASDQDLIQTISAAEEVLGLDVSDADENSTHLTASLDALDALKTAVRGPDKNEGLVSYAEGVIGQGISKIVASKTGPSKEDVGNTQRLLDLVATVLRSSNPSVEDGTEADFERSASWGSPAARVEIASAILDLMLQRPDLYSEVTKAIDDLITDQHPAVRLQAGLHLVRLWDLDRSGFWSRLEDRLQNECNLSVLTRLINSVVGRLLHSDPDRTNRLAVLLTTRFSKEPERQAKLDEALASVLAVLWITYEQEPAREVLSNWIRA